VDEGTAIGVTFRAPARSGLRIVLKHGGVTVASKSTGGARNGHLSFSTASLAPTNYSVSLAGLGTAGPTPNLVTVVPVGSHGTVAVTKKVFAVGEKIKVTWQNDPGNRYDWLSVNPVKGTPWTDDLLEWRYTNSEIDGHGSIDVRAHGTWPLKAGNYRVWLCLDDGYVCSDSASFSVR
jgi:hypothetical protein